MRDARQELGLSTEGFLSLTWAEYNDKLEHHKKRREEWWIHDRLIVSTLWNTRFGAKEMVKPEDIIRLSIDDESPEIRMYTEEDLDRELKGLDTLFDRLMPINYKES